MTRVYSHVGSMEKYSNKLFVDVKLTSKKLKTSALQYVWNFFLNVNYVATFAWFNS